MDDLNKLPAEEASDQLPNESPHNENTGETSDAGLSLGDLSDVDTEVDDSLGMLSPSLLAPLLAPLLQTDQEEEAGPTPNKLELEAESSSTDPFSSLFDGLVITGQEEQQEQPQKEEEKEEKEIPLPAEKTEEVEDAILESSTASASLLDTKESASEIEHEEEVVVEVEEAPIAIPEPPAPQPESLPPSPPPEPQPPQQKQQQKKNKVHYPDIPGASLLELAEHAESRLAFGSSSSSATTSTTTGPSFTSLQQSPFEGGESSDFQLPETNLDTEEEGQAFKKQLLVARLVSQLDSSSSSSSKTDEATTSVAGSPASSPPQIATTKNTSMGSNLAARAFISPQLEPVFKRTGGSAGTATPSTSIPSVIAKYLGIVAVGTSAGTVNVLMPKAGGKGPPHLHSLEDKTTLRDGVTAVALGQHAGGLLLLAGHASGQLRLWETKPITGGSSSGGGGSTGGVTWVLARTVSGVHASAVTAITVIDGGATTWALSADAHGRLMCHSVNRLLSITAQALAGFARQWAGGGAAAAAASASSLVSLEAAGQDPGVVLSLSPLGNISSTIGTSVAPGQSSGASQQQQQQQAKTLYSTTEGSHFILLVATRAVLLAALSAEGSLSILHIFFPPPALQGEATGSAAWRLEVATDTHQIAKHATHAVVAIAWCNSITIYRCSLTRPGKALSPQPSPSKGITPAAAGGGGGKNSPGSPPRAAATPLPPPELLSNFSTEHPVNGLAFIGPLSALVVASAEGEVATEIAIYHPLTFFSTTKEESVDQSSTSDSGTVEKLKIDDWMVVRQLGIPGAASLQGSLALSSGASAGGGASGDQLLVLTSRGVRVIHLLTWQQRLSTLVGMQKLEVAMLSAVRLYLQATTPSVTTSATAATAAAGNADCLWPADGAAPSDAEEIARQLLTILHAFIDSKLATLVAQSDNSDDNDQEAEQLADIAVNTCLLLSRSDALFDDIAPKFLSSPYSSAFLTQLEPRILADELPSLAPEVMQALVEHFAHSGQLERIEKCVLKLDILSLDLNQLIPLCLRHGLYGALIHIFIGALQDYQTPATLLLIAAATASATPTTTTTAPSSSTFEDTSNSNSSNKDILEGSLSLQLGYRLLVYLHGCLSGRQYPPGSGHAPPQQQQTMRLHAVTFLLHVNTATLLDTWQLWASVAHLDTDNNTGDGSSSAGGRDVVSSLPSLLHDPSPVLRYLCQMDAPAVLGVLSDGLKGWDALESDLVELSPELTPLILSNSSSGSTSMATGGRTITQAAVDAVVHLLREDTEHGSEQQSALLKFVAEHLAAHRASAEDAVLLRVLRFLAENNEKNGDFQLSLAERESIFKDIVVHIHGSGENNIRTNPQVRGEALDLARKAGFHQAEARIRHAERAFSQSFTCLVEDGTRYPRAPFQYLRDICFDPGLTESDRNLVKSTALKLAPQLVRIDPGETAAVVAECFSQESHVAVLEGLAPWPDDQFAFLQAAIEGHTTRSSLSNGNLNGARAISGGGIQRPESGLSRSTSTRPISPESTLDSFRGDPLFAPLLNNKGVSSLYVRLLCRFQPHDVLPFLQSHDTYNVDECLTHCIEHGAREAAAFLLERKGDVKAALAMYLAQVDVANSALVGAVKEQGVEGIPSYYTGGSISSTTKTSFGGSSISSAPQMTLTAAGPKSPAAPPAPPVSSSLLKEFVAARDAMNSAVSMCVRFAQDRMTPVNSPVLVEEQLKEEQVVDATAGDGVSKSKRSSGVEGQEDDDDVDFKGDPVRAVWFEVLQRYVTVIRTLRAEEKQQGSATPTIPSATAATTAPAPASVVTLDRLTCLERIFTAFMEEVISQMAGHVPLHSIAAAVLQKYSGDSFGDFRATLSSLLGACNFELAILRCASRVTGTDTIALLKQGYTQCMMPQVVGTEQEQQNINLENNNSGVGGLDGASGSSSNQRSMEAALRSLESAQQIGQDAWAKAAAAAGPAASKLLEKAGFA